MGFTLQGFGPFLHWLTLVILCVLPVLAAFVLFKLGGLPGAIAKARGHPQAAAINVCGWMGIITIVMWPIAMVWAHFSPGRPADTGGLSETDTKSLLGKLRQLSQRICEVEASLVRTIFARYLELGTVRAVETELAACASAMPGRMTKAGRCYGARAFSRGQLYKLLSNPIYCGDISHKGTRYPGQHPAIVTGDVFAQVAQRLATNRHERKLGRNAKVPSLLAGLLRDANGDRLVATHATKQGKRYRYYISKALHDGRRRGRLGRDHIISLEARGDAVWRPPATEIKRNVLDAIRSAMLDRTRLTELMGPEEAERPWPIAARTAAANAAATAATILTGEDPAERRAMILRLVSHIEVAASGITIALARKGLTGALGLDGEPAAVVVAESPRLTIPVALRLRGVETRLVLTADGNLSEPDQTLIRALARARRWMADLVEGVHGSVVDLAQAYRTNPNSVARHLPLAYLAPRVVEAMLGGRQPVDLTTWDLLNRIKIPRDWDAQTRRLGCG